MQLIRQCLKDNDSGFNSNWRTVRNILCTQYRVTASFRRGGGKDLQVRKATHAEPKQLAIYRALKTDPAPEGIRKTII